MEEVNDEGQLQGVRGDAWILSHGTAWADSVPQMVRKPLQVWRRWWDCEVTSGSQEARSG